MRRRTTSSSMRRQHLYTAILAEHSQRAAFHRDHTEIKQTMHAPDPRDPLAMARAAAAALKGSRA